MDKCYIGTTYVNDKMYLTHSMDKDDLIKPLLTSTLEHVAEDLKRLSNSTSIPVIKFEDNIDEY
jgi:hypothetical protein